MRLSTNRFVLRDFVEADIPAFVDYHRDPRFRELYGPGENTPEHASELIELFMTWASEAPRTKFQLAIIHQDGSLVGCCGLRLHEAGADNAEFGIELAPVFWGRFAYAVEPMARLLEFGFGELGLAQISGITVSANARIARLASAFGAASTVIETPAWMSARGWQQLEWRIRGRDWRQSRFGRHFAAGQGMRQP